MVRWRWTVASSGSSTCAGSEKAEPDADRSPPVTREPGVASLQRLELSDHDDVGALLDRLVQRQT